MLPACSRAQARAQHPPEHEHPDEQPDREQHLPDAREVEVLEALQAEPVGRRVAEHAVHAQERADQRAEHHHGERAEQQEGELALTARLAPGDHRREEDAGRHERGRDPEDRELHVPGAHQVEGQQLGEVDAEEARPAPRDSAVRRRRPCTWITNSAAITKKNHAHARWAGRERDVAGRAEAQRGLLASVPAEDVPAPESGEQQADAAQQRDQRQHRPDDHVGRWLVVDPRLGRPVVGVGVVVTGPLGRAGPGRPAEERRQSGEIAAVGDRVRAQAVLGGGLGEEARVVRHQPAVRLGLRLGQLQHTCALVVAVGRGSPRSSARARESERPPP